MKELHNTHYEVLTFAIATDSTKGAWKNLVLDLRLAGLLPYCPIEITGNTDDDISTMSKKRMYKVTDEMLASVMFHPMWLAHEELTMIGFVLDRSYTQKLSCMFYKHKDGRHAMLNKRRYVMIKQSQFGKIVEEFMYKNNQRVSI